MPRPREFDPDDVLDKAMRLFWEKGYLGTSVQDLVDRTGINRASLYAVFGDKHSLFLKALARYRRSVVPGRAGILERDDASLPEIREYFEAVAGDLAGSRERKGCLMVNSAMELAAHDRDVSRQVGAHLGQLEKAFAKALARAVERGEIAAAADVGRLASFLVTASQGLMVVGKANPDRRRLRDTVEATLGALG